LFLLAGLVYLAGLAAGQNQAAGKVDVAKLKAKLLQGSFIEGHLVKVNEDEKRFTFQYVYEVKKPVPAAQAKYAEIARRWSMALAMRSTGLEDLKKLQEEGRAAYKAAFEIDQTPIDFELKGEKNLAVRTMLAPTDADGKLKKLTAAEQQKLKGDPRLPGYSANLKEITEKQWVRVFIDRTKKPTPGKDGEPTIYPITMIQVVQPPAESDPFVIPGQ